MKPISKILATGGVALSVILLSTTSGAATLLCPEPLAEGQQNQLELSGADGNPTCAGAWDAPSTNQVVFFEELSLLWKIDFGEKPGTEGMGPNPFISFSGGNDISGDFTLIDGLNDHVISFKFGGGQTTPNLFAYNINGMTTADWNLLPDETTRNALSNVAIWGQPVDAPEPGALALLGAGLLALLAIRRRFAA